jgi:hypothetical protein
MALVDVPSLSDLVESVTHLQRLLRVAGSYLRRVRAQEVNYLRRNVDISSVNTDIEAHFTEIEDIFDRLVADINSYPWIYGVQIRPNPETGMSTISITTYADSSNTKISLPASFDELSLLQASDVIKIENSNDGDYDGWYVVQSVGGSPSGNEVTLSESIEDTDKTVSHDIDTGFKITLVQRDVT